jgi:hypothetical protein
MDDQQRFFQQQFEQAVGSMMQGAAAGGSIAVLEWLRYEQFVQFNESLIQSAAHYNQLAMIQYLRATGCPWEASACTAAVMCFSDSATTQSSSAATLQWLHQHGCPWNLTELYRLAAERGDIAVLSYIIQQGGVPEAAVMTEMLNATGALGKLDAAKWLRQQDAEWSAVLEYDIRHGHGKPIMLAWWDSTLKWARSEG